MEKIPNEYNDVSNSSESEELERLRSFASLEEASALKSEWNKGRTVGMSLSDTSRPKELADIKAEIANKYVKLVEKDAI
jgi:hypothetical protein